MNRSNGVYEGKRVNAMLGKSRLKNKKEVKVERQKVLKIEHLKKKEK